MTSTGERYSTIAALDSGSQIAQDAAANAMTRLPDAVRQAEHRLGELRAALVALPPDPAPNMLADLASALAGHVESEVTIGDLNARLRESIDHITFRAESDGTVKVVAYLSDEFLLSAGGDPEALAVMDFHLAPDCENVRHRP
jgi:hypothetical protein